MAKFVTIHLREKRCVVSRQDHRKHDVEIERQRKIQAEAERQNRGFRFRWVDSLTVVGVLLAIPSLISEDTILVIGCFVVSALLICLSVYSHKEWKSWRYVIAPLIIVLFSGLSVRAYTKGMERELSRLQGRLFPSNEPTPANWCSSRYLDGDGVFILMGFATSYVDQFPHTVISVDKQPRLVVHRDADKTIWISLDIFGGDGRIIAELGKDGFTVREHSYFKFTRKDRSSLAIVDEFKQEVLNVRYVNPRAIWINAVLRYPNSNPVIFRGSEGGGICTAHAGTAEIEFTTKPEQHD